MTSTSISQSTRSAIKNTIGSATFFQEIFMGYSAADVKGKPGRSQGKS
jgi:hypothetical protein